MFVDVSCALWLFFLFARLLLVSLFVVDVAHLTRVRGGGW